MVIELHYDNPKLERGKKPYTMTWVIYNYVIVLSFTGIVDNSGYELVYTTTPPRQLAGIITLGTISQASMIIPPNADNYTLSALCSSKCTENVSLKQKNDHYN